MENPTVDIIEKETDGTGSLKGGSLELSRLGLGITTPYSHLCLTVVSNAGQPRAECESVAQPSMKYPRRHVP